MNRTSQLRHTQPVSDLKYMHAFPTWESVRVLRLDMHTAIELSEGSRFEKRSFDSAN